MKGAEHKTIAWEHYIPLYVLTRNLNLLFFLYINDFLLKIDVEKTQIGITTLCEAHYFHSIPLTQYTCQPVVLAGPHRGVNPTNRNVYEGVK